MVTTSFHMQPFYRPGPLTVDTVHAQKFFEDDDATLLDDHHVLNHASVDSGLEMSPQMVESRRDSFAVPGTLFPLKDEWQSVDMQSIPSNNPFVEHHHSQSQSQQHAQPHSNNPFVQSQQAFPPQRGWPLASGPGSGSCTPHAHHHHQHFDAVQADFDSSPVVCQRPHGLTPFSNPSNHVTMLPSLSAAASSVAHAQPSYPSSPQKDWVSDLKGHGGLPKKMRPGTPSLPRSHNELRRGDGIRKKNARFDIPAERNLGNIDSLIAQSTDELEIKELKQQKRLLRNRQAALDSRQRKKQHTERLEQDKKEYTQLLTDMEEEISDLKSQVERLLCEKASYTEYIDSLHVDKEELIRSHTLETGELRKKVSVLSTHVQRLETAMSSPVQPVSHPQPSTAFASGPAAFTDMDGMTMDGSWDGMQLFSDFSVEQPAVEIKQEHAQMQLVPLRKAEAVPSSSSDAEKANSNASQGGLLFMLFLVGAFVLSSRSSTPSIPRVSDDVRAASATLLENVLKDAGVASKADAVGLAPQPSGSVWPPASAASVSAAAGPSSSPAAATGMRGLDGVAPSMLGDLADSLTRPTQDQTNEQLFSLTPAQYNSVTSADYLNSHVPERTTSQGRRNLADALAAMHDGGRTCEARPDGKQSVAEVYTRSLLWDQIPQDVVRSFVKMVGDCSDAPTADSISAGA